MSLLREVGARFWKAMGKEYSTEVLEKERDRVCFLGSVLGQQCGHWTGRKETDWVVLG